MVKFATLYSGSSGNSCVIWDENTSVLIDLGGSCRKTVSALKQLGLDPAALSAVLITHEHSDHIGGIEVFCRHYDIPLYGTRQTRDYLTRRDLIGPLQRYCEILAGRQFKLGSFIVTPFATPHDSLSCHGYRLETAGSSIAVATDLGRMTDEIYSYIRGCGTVALESNYDTVMLRNGPYPQALKMRIAAPTGHLSNAKCAATAVRLAQQGTRQLILMHLSAENNAPAIALTACAAAFEDAELAEDCCRISTAPRFDVSDIWEV